MMDAIGEARENIKFLGTLDKALAPLKSGQAAPADLQDALPALFSSLHMLQAASKCALPRPAAWSAVAGQPAGCARQAGADAAQRTVHSAGGHPVLPGDLTLSQRLPCRYYAKQEHTGRVLRKVSNQVVKSCTAHILAGGQLWERPRPGLIADLTASAQMHDAYVTQYRSARRPTRPAPGLLSSKWELTGQATAHASAPTTTQTLRTLRSCCLPAASALPSRGLCAGSPGTGRPRGPPRRALSSQRPRYSAALTCWPSAAASWRPCSPPSSSSPR